MQGGSSGGIRISVDPVAVLDWEQARIDGAETVAQDYISIFDSSGRDMRKLGTKLYRRELYE